MNIEVYQLSKAELDAKGVSQWPIWEKETSRFDWFYEETEECYVLEGHVVIISANQTIEIKAGDYVRFPKGLTCVWEVKKTIRKHYNFL